MNRKFSTKTACVCGSGNKMENCCLPLLRGEEHASSPEILMRSRFTAYALGGFGEYLLKTWMPEKRLLLTTEELSCKSTDWKALEILNQSTEKEKAFDCI